MSLGPVIVSRSGVNDGYVRRLIIWPIAISESM